MLSGLMTGGVVIEGGPYAGSGVSGALMRSDTELITLYYHFEAVIANNPPKARLQIEQYGPLSEDFALFLQPVAHAMHRFDR